MKAISGFMFCTHFALLQLFSSCHGNLIPLFTSNFSEPIITPGPRLLTLPAQKREDDRFIGYETEGSTLTSLYCPDGQSLFRFEHYFQCYPKTEKQCQNLTPVACAGDGIIYSESDDSIRLTSFPCSLLAAIPSPYTSPVSCNTVLLYSNKQDQTPLTGFECYNSARTRLLYRIKPDDLGSIPLSTSVLSAETPATPSSLPPSPENSTLAADEQGLKPWMAGIIIAPFAFLISGGALVLYHNHFLRKPEQTSPPDHSDELKSAVSAVPFPAHHSELDSGQVYELESPNTVQQLPTHVRVRKRLSLPSLSMQADHSIAELASISSPQLATTRPENPSLVDLLYQTDNPELVEVFAQSVNRETLVTVHEAGVQTHERPLTS